MSAALFLCVGVVYDRMHSREISTYGGLVERMPVYAVVFLLFTLANVGLPGTSGFVGEFLTLFGTFRVNIPVATLATLGFDNLMTPRSTIAFSLISEWQMGDPKLTLPGPIDLVSPFQRRIESTSIPTRRDDRLDASLGLKFNLRGGSVFVLNGTVPLRKAGMQPDFFWTSGIEISF